ncbi:hypothetical protein [Rhizobium sp. AN80A]|uniref:hypothetical protein n=1 Tax=Rhizobium sp. AN80A TaxID=3040673 RepID=UPI0032C3DC9F
MRIRFGPGKGQRLHLHAATPSPQVTRFAAGFSETFHGELWRIYSLSIPNKRSRLRSPKRSISDKVLSRISPSISPFRLSFSCQSSPSSSGLAIKNGLGSIRGLVSQIRTKTSDDLSIIATRTLLRDLTPLVHPLNNLLRKLGRSLTMERRFSDLAAHQLRRPQAGIKLLLQHRRSINRGALHPSHP